jgi:DNA transposition AAA+ family ATPase
MDIRADIKRFLEEKGVSQSRFAKTIGVNPAYLSNYLEAGDDYKYADRVKEPAAKYLHNFADKKQDAKTYDIPFVLTRDVKNAFFVMDDAAQIGAMAVITGAPGCGKTRAAREYASLRPNVVLIEATIKTRAVELFEIIAKKLGVKTVASQDKMVRACAEELKRSEKFFIIDEAEHLPYAALELLRRLHDFSAHAVILCGTEVLVDNLRGANVSTRRSKEYRQLSSRIVGKYEFKELVYARESVGKMVEEQKDLAAFCGSLGEMDKEAVKALRLLSRGNPRKTKNLFQRAQRLAEFGKVAVDAEIIKEASAMVFLD